MKEKKILALVLVFALAFSTLWGCSDNGDNAGDGAASTQQGNVVSEGTDGAKIGADDSSNSVSRDVVNVAIAADVGTWDPFNLTTLECRSGVYQGLGYFIDGEYYPCLMKSYTISDDMMSIDCEIFDYIYDSNGAHMTAADIVWSYEMANAGTTAGLTDIVESCEQTGEYTFRFNLKDTLQIGRIDKMVKWYAVCRESYEADPEHMATKPVGTGPYKVTNLTSGYSITLERRDDYWQTDDSQRCFRDAANAETVNYYIVSESAQRAIALQDGTIDMVTSLSAEDLETFRDSKDFWLYSVTADKSMDFAPNCDPGSPLSDINLRLACFYAIDPMLIVNSVYSGDAFVNHSMGPDWSTGYQEQWTTEENYYNIYDVDLAKEYLEKSSYSGEKLTIMCTSSTNPSLAAQVVQLCLEAIGINSEIKALERNVFQTYQKTPSEWDICIYETACNTYWMDAANGQLGTQRTGADYSLNFITDPDLQAMLDYSMSLANNSDETNAQVHEYIIENAYWYSMVNYTNYMVVPNWCSRVALSSAKSLIPGASEFTE